MAIVRSVSEQTLRHWADILDGIADPQEQIRRIAGEFPEHVRQLTDAYHVIHGALATSRDRKVSAVASLNRVIGGSAPRRSAARRR